MLPVDKSDCPTNTIFNVESKSLKRTNTVLKDEEISLTKKQKTDGITEIGNEIIMQGFENPNILFNNDENTICFGDSPLIQLPNEIKNLILFQSNLNGIKKMMLMNTQWKIFIDSNETLWGAVGQALHFPLFNTCIQVKRMTTMMQEHLDFIFPPRTFKPALQNELYELQGNVKIENLNKLQTMIKARDVLVVFAAMQRRLVEMELGHTVNLMNLNFKLFDSVDAFNDMINVFQLWCIEHHDSLLNLDVLYLDDRKLTFLPAEIGLLTNLEQLDLKNNYLSFLPQELGNLKNLYSLIVNNNQLTSIPITIGELENLTELYLYDNNLTCLPNEIVNLTNLEFLFISNNNLTASSLPKDIHKLKLKTPIDL